MNVNDNWSPLHLSDGQILYVAKDELIWVRDSAGNVSLAAAAAAFAVTGTGDISLTSTGVGGKVVLSSNQSEIDITAHTLVAISAADTISLISTKGVGVGVSLLANSGSAIKILNSHASGQITIESSGGAMLLRNTGSGGSVTVATTGTNGDINIDSSRHTVVQAVGTLQLQSVGGASALVILSTNGALGTVQIGNTGVNAETVQIHGETVEPQTGAVNGNLLTRVGGKWIGQTPAFMTTALTNTHILVGNGSGVATDVAMSGDATIANTGAVTLKNTGPGATTKGTAASSNTTTIDAQGRVTSLGDTPIQIAESQVTGLVADLALKAPLASPALTGHPTGVTESPSDNSTRLATTAYADAAVAAIPSIGSIDALLAMGYYD